MLIDDKSVWGLVEARAAATPDGLLAVDEHDRSMTFAEYRAAAERVAAGLLALGGGVGRVAWQLPTWTESMVLVAALSRLGATQVPMLPIYREREVRFIIGQSRPDLFLVPSSWRGFDYEALARGVACDAGNELRVEVCDRHLPEGDPSTLPPHAGLVEPDAPRWIFYTSGTTADPKGALHTDRSLIAGSYGISASFACSEADRYPLVFPFTHIGGIGMLLVQLVSGCGAIITERFDPAETMPLLSRHGMTLAAGGTPLALLYLEAQRQHPGGRLFPALRAVITGSAPKSDDLHFRLREELGGSGALSCYGLTEVPFLAVSNVDDPDDKRATTEGRAIAGATVRITDADGSPCPPGTLGEICARGPQVCLGYLDGSLDAQAFDDDGYFKTGDLGTLDAEGYVRILGRLKDIIIRKGENISAKEVEDVLARHPGIADVAVIGRADAVLGERCCAIVVPRDGCELTLAEVASFCRDAGVAVQKVPEELEIIDALPRNASGKVLKYKLKEMFP
jgi:acyl-CoA synthetase (AMP-forming)/AMP-acid ligase II